jgi:hypothetical protein
MRELLLLRHAKSSWDDATLDDADRPLAARGRKAAPVMARAMARRGWMPDLAEFFATTRRILKPHGSLVIYEQHPLLNMFDSRDTRVPPQPDESYFRNEPYRSDQGLDYWNEESYDAQPCYWHFHKTSDIVMALLHAGFTLEDFEELPHNVGDYYRFENLPQQLPLSYILVGRREG